MLDEAELAVAVDLHGRAYRLLRWLDHAARKGTVRLDQLHENMSAASAARQWVEFNYFDLPAKLRPRQPRDPELSQFANLLASYLTASFDLIDEPGTRKASDCGCWCSFCTYLVSMPYLKPKRLKIIDKRRAHDRIREYLARLAIDRGCSSAAVLIDQVFNDPVRLEKAAMATWGEILVRRMRGEPRTRARWPSGGCSHRSPRAL